MPATSVPVSVFAIVSAIGALLGLWVQPARAQAFDVLAFGDTERREPRTELSLSYRPLGVRTPGYSERAEQFGLSVNLDYPLGPKWRAGLAVSASMENGASVTGGGVRHRRPGRLRADALAAALEYTVSSTSWRRTFIASGLQIPLESPSPRTGYEFSAGIALIRDPVAVQLGLSWERPPAGPPSQLAGHARLLFVANERYSLEQSWSFLRPSWEPVSVNWGSYVHYRQGMSVVWKAGVELQVWAAHPSPAFIVARSATW